MESSDLRAVCEDPVTTSDAGSRLVDGMTRSALHGWRIKSKRVVLAGFFSLDISFSHDSFLAVQQPCVGSNGYSFPMKSIFSLNLHLPDLAVSMLYASRRRRNDASKESPVPFRHTQSPIWPPHHNCDLSCRLLITAFGCLACLISSLINSIRIKLHTGPGRSRWSNMRHIGPR